MEYVNSRIIVIAVVVIIFGVAAFAVGGELFMHHSRSLNPGTSPGRPTGGSGAVATRTAVPPGTTVPDAASATVSPNGGVPAAVAPGDPSGSSSYRRFAITVSNDAFSPKAITVYAGDTVALTFRVVDAAYDFTLPDYGVRVSLPEGTVRDVQFSPDAAGDFLFYCTRCGGPQRGPVGSLIVVAPQR